MEKQIADELKYTCCICGKEFMGWGNNPDAIKKSGRCCDACNKKVINARLWNMLSCNKKKAGAR